MAEQPIFPLRTVLFPDGLLELKIFEARYLDLVSRCLREQAPFGVVALRAGSEARGAGGEPVVRDPAAAARSEAAAADARGPGRSSRGRRFVAALDALEAVSGDGARARTLGCERRSSRRSRKALVDDALTRPWWLRPEAVS